MLDIVPGDVLVVGSREYPVRVAASWPAANRAGIAIRRNATVDASTKRTPTETGKRGTPTTYLTGLKITPLDPMSGDRSTGMLETSGLDTPFVALQSFAQDDDGFVHMLLEDLYR